MTVQKRFRRESIFVYAEFDLNALLTLATSMRGRAVKCDRSQYLAEGAMNWALEISFDDGVHWIFRSPKINECGSTMTEASTFKLLASEAATLIFLKEKTTVPVPEVYSFSASHDNEIGIPYILMSKAAGRPLAGAMGFNKEGRIKVSTQLGVIARKIYNNAFEKIESLHLVDGGIYDIGECLAPSLIWQWRDELEDIARGPYANDNQYFEALISAFISHAKELYMSPHAFAPIPDPDDYADSNASRAASDRWNAFLTIGCKVEHSKNRLAYCVAGELMREMLPLMCGGSGAEGGFPLINPDLHHSNIFVDDNFNITCLIDWSSAHTTPVTEMPLASRLKSNPPSDTEFDHFEEGFGSEGDLELPDEWRGKARVLWPFERLIRMLARQELALFEMLFDLAWPSSSIPMPELFFQRSKMEDNRKLLAELAADDMTPEDVEKEEAYVGMRDNKAEIEQIAVARKLTVMAEMNPLFVADRTLWRWLGETLDDDKQSCE